MIEQEEWISHMNSTRSYLSQIEQQALRDAILACESIDYILLTLPEIASMYDVDEQILCEHILRYSPDLLEDRECLRKSLGELEGSETDSVLTATGFETPVLLLRTHPEMTVWEAALRTDTPYQLLLNHLSFYHRDLLESCNEERIRAVNCVASAEQWQKGGLSAVRYVRYSPAIELYRTTDLSVKEIAEKLGLVYEPLLFFLETFCSDVMQERQLKREALSARNLAMKGRKVNQVRTATEKYSPAIELLRQGKNLKEAAMHLNVDAGDLSTWLKRYHREVLEETKTGMMRLKNGRRVMRSRYERYKPVAKYMRSHPSRPTKAVSKRFKLPDSSICKAIRDLFPDVWEKHLTACNNE